MYEEKRQRLRKRNRWLQGFSLLLAIMLPVGFMTYNVVSTQDVKCSVCVTYKGRQQCKEATGPAIKECSITAIDNACAFIASGMTEVMACTTEAHYDIEQIN